MSELAGKTALVTGTAHGIGAAIAATLEQMGARVHGVDKDTVDVTDPGAVTSLVEEIGSVDILVNNAGGVVGQVHHPIEEIRDEDWRAVVDANLTSTFLCTRAVVPGTPRPKSSGKATARKASDSSWSTSPCAGSARRKTSPTA